YLRAADTLSAHDEVVYEPILLLRCTVIPVILDEDRVDSVSVIGPDPVQTRRAALRLTIDPELEEPVALTSVVQPNPGFDAVPLTHVRRAEDRREARLAPHPAEVGAIVVAGGPEVTLSIGS